jgi:deoxyadenosine/deoxycytidine kinase
MDLSRYNYIANGNIMPEKTTLSTKIVEDFNAKKRFWERSLLTTVLPKFYKDQNRYAFR